MLVFITPDVLSKRELPPSGVFLGILPLGYMIAIIPAWLSAVVDWALSRKPFRLVGTTVAGAVIAELAALYFGHVVAGYEGVLTVGLIGAIPAALCSCLSNYPFRSGLPES